jgi:hypothetical protein
LRWKEGEHDTANIEVPMPSPFSSLYLQAYNDQCTGIWLDFLTAELKKEVDKLEECRLTSDDVPVIGQFFLETDSKSI